MSLMNDNQGMLDLLVEQLNIEPSVFAVRINDVIYVTKKNTMGDVHLTITDYHGMAFLVKCFKNKELLFGHITTTPVALIGLVIERIR